MRRLAWDWAKSESASKNRAARIEADGNRRRIGLMKFDAIRARIVYAWGSSGSQLSVTIQCPVSKSPAPLKSSCDRGKEKFHPRKATEVTSTARSRVQNRILSRPFVGDPRLRPSLKEQDGATAELAGDQKPTEFSIFPF